MAVMQQNILKAINITNYIAINATCLVYRADSSFIVLCLA